MEEYKGIQISQSISDKSLFYNVETDSVQNPQHYSGGIQPIEFMQAQMDTSEFIGFLKGNIIKYVTRAGKKENTPAIKDLAKAKRYLDWLCETFEGKTINPRK